jgi:hypothetical protein
MIKVQKNFSFIGWFQIFLNGRLVEEVLGQEIALEYSKKLAKEYDMYYIYFIDEVVSVD